MKNSNQDLNQEDIISNAKYLRRGYSLNGISLRELNKNYTKEILEWRNEDSNRKWFKSQSVINKESHEAWISTKSQSVDDINWIIATDLEGPIGTVSLYNIDWSNKSAEFGRFLIGNPSGLGKGYGLTVIKMVLCLASIVNLNKVWLEVKSDNDRAIHLYKKAGFVAYENANMVMMSRSVIGLSSQIDSPY